MTDWIASRTPEPPHPFANWIANDEWVIISGIVGIAPDGSIPADPTEQARLALGATAHFLAEAGSSLDEVVLVRPHVTAREDAPLVDIALREVFSEVPPAGGALTIVGLVHPDFKVEFDIWASRGAKRIPFAGA